MLDIRLFAGRIDVAKAIILLLYVVSCALWMLRTGDFPRIPQGDVVLYARLAEKIRTAGPFVDLGEIRTYGYPIFLAMVSIATGRDAPTLVFGAGLVQSLAFLAAVGWLSSLLRDRSRWSLAVFGGLLLNPFLIDMITDGLTEGIVATIVVLMVAILIKATRADGVGIIIWLLSGIVLASASFIIRPANVIVIVSWVIVSLICILYIFASNREKLKFIGLFLIASSLLILLILSPQIYHNYYFYSKMTPFPVVRLGESQLEYGVKLWKYATVILNSQAHPLNYVNPLFGGFSDRISTPIQWYLENPSSGVLTIFAHIFNAFNYDYPNVYIFNLTFPSVMLAMSVWVAQTVGIIELGRQCRNLISRRDLKGSEGFIVLAYLGAVTVQTVAIIAVSGVENRFAFIPTAILFVFAWHAILGIGSWSRQRTVVTLLLCAISSFVGAAGTLYMKTLMTTQPLS